MQVRGLAAASAPLAKVASAAVTVIVPSTLLGHACQPWADAAPAGGANARWRWLLVRVGASPVL